jgi:hypothetical protein
LEKWSSFPVLHKKRLWQAVGIYALLCIAVSGWVSMHAEKTLKDWQERIPSAKTVIRSVPTGAQTADALSSGTARTGQTYVSIILSGMGLSAATTEKALSDLPRGVSLAFSPYADDLEMWMKKAEDLNRETLIYLPMETAVYPQHDPGPRALSSRLSDKDNENNLKWVLRQGKGSVGVINYMGSRFLADRKRLTPTFKTLQENGAMFIEIPHEGGKSEASSIADGAKLPYLAVDLKIDGTVTEKAIEQQLEALEKIARERGYAIGIAEPYPMTLNALRSWTTKLPARSIALTSLSTVWKNNPDHGQKNQSEPSEKQLKQP